MFDTPDMMPVCLAPILALLVGTLIYAAGRIMAQLTKRKKEETPNWKTWETPVVLLAVLSIPIMCITSAALQIGANDPVPWFKPSFQDVAGKWQLAPGTIEVLENWDQVQIRENTILFNDDGTFIMQNVPNFWREPRLMTDVDERYINGSGTWSIVRQFEQWSVILKFNEINDAKYRNTYVPLYFANHLPPYQLEILGFEGQDPYTPTFRFDKH